MRSLVCEKSEGVSFVVKNHHNEKFVVINKFFRIIYA